MHLDGYVLRHAHRGASSLIARPMRARALMRCIGRSKSLQIRERPGGGGTRSVRRKRTVHSTDRTNGAVPVSGRQSQVMVTRRKPRSTRSAPPPTRRTEKLQRWLDLLAGLLVRQYMVLKGAGRFFVVGVAEQRRALRVYRLDRIAGVAEINEPRATVSRVSLDALSAGDRFSARACRNSASATGPGSRAGSRNGSRWSTAQTGRRSRRFR